MTRIVRRLLVVLVAVATTWSTAGPATAGPAVAGTRTTSFFASAFLGSGGSSGSDDVFVDLQAWAPAGVAPFGNGEFFVRGYDCLTEETVRAWVDGLRAAGVRGRLPLDCSFHGPRPPGLPPHVTGMAVVNVRWTGVGPVTYRTLDEPGSPCVYRFADRHAEVSGRVRIVIPALRFTAVATPLHADSDHITRERAICS